MNCKPGDLAIVLGGKLSAGRIVRVLKLVPAGYVTRCLDSGMPFRCSAPEWLIEGSIYRTIGGDKPKIVRSDICRDKSLFPIRDHGDDAKDEMLCPLPHKEIA